jgi:hypothetical protein
MFVLRIQVTAVEGLDACVIGQAIVPFDEDLAGARQAIGGDRGLLRKERGGRYDKQEAAGYRRGEYLEQAT